MGDVVDLGSLRSSSTSPLSADYDGLICPECGCAWFEICTIDRGEKLSGLVCMNTEGRVTGYAGTPHCFDCGTEVIAQRIGPNKNSDAEATGGAVEPGTDGTSFGSHAGLQESRAASSASDHCAWDAVGGGS